jgi:hypothetical protein
MVVVHEWGKGDKRKWVLGGCTWVMGCAEKMLEGGVCKLLVEGSI